MCCQKTILRLMFLLGVVHSVFSQKLISPCPEIFHYTEKENEPGKWYGTAIVTSDTDLNGVTFRIHLDSQSIQLGNWFGDVEPTDNHLGYLVKNPEYKLKAKQPLKLKFFVRYDTNSPPPKLSGIALNSVKKCPSESTGTSRVVDEEVISEVIEKLASRISIEALTDPANTTIASDITEKPKAKLSEDSDDFFHGDYNEQEHSLLDSAKCGRVPSPLVPLLPVGLVDDHSRYNEAEFPWHASLYHSKGIDLTYICGASLITLHHLVTAAHCVTRKKSQNTVNPANLIVYLGKFYQRIWKTPGIQDRHVDKIIVNSNYNPQSLANDIAVMKMTEPAELTFYVRPVCLWEGTTDLDSVVNRVGKVIGWGYDETGKLTDQLTEAKMKIVSQETCVDSFPEIHSTFTSSSTFCAGFDNGTSVCNGDSGGGLFLTKSVTGENNPVWHIRGLVSISVALQNNFRCNFSHYVVFTDIARHLSFVKDALIN